VKETKGDLAGAMKEAEAATALRHDDASANLCLANLHYRLGCSLQLRRKVYKDNHSKDKKALGIAKQTAETHFQKALELYQHTLSQDRSSFFAQCGIGAVLAHKDKKHEANVIFRGLQDNLAPGSGEVNVVVNLGHLLMDYGRNDAKAYSKAVEYYEKAFSLDSENADVILYLAVAYYKLERHADAERTLNWGLFIHPSDPRMHLDHATMVELHGNKIVSSESAGHTPDTVKKGATLLTAAARRFDFLSELRSKRSDEDVTKKLHRSTLQQIDDLENTYLSMHQLTGEGTLEQTLQKHLEYCSSSADKAKSWASPSSCTWPWLITSSRGMRMRRGR
jgi:tetratricopeptide (TPR) repeat protein